MPREHALVELQPAEPSFHQRSLVLSLVLSLLVPLMASGIGDSRIVYLRYPTTEFAPEVVEPITFSLGSSFHLGSFWSDFQGQVREGFIPQSA
ncbi:Uu.00g066180.m01.CDS01 [Anthostomella pinea]|uniref:Uu.00g066180.m01.CDS01 n=1 Tax=Anthostomella pinea TaxID=933095 RepID=A0AAI8VV37_9PEZI|nr:Uu.00g066180.m01.CDS01 [Anthostomella pinea]